VNQKPREIEESGLAPDGEAIVDVDDALETPGAIKAAREKDMKALTDAFTLFTETTQTMEESYRRLEGRLESVDQELQKKNRELALATDYLNSILDSMSDGVIALDTQGEVTTFNHAAAEVLGFDPVDVVGKPYRHVFGAECAEFAGRRVMDLPTADRSRIPVSVENAPLADRSGARTGTVVVFQDLREIEHLREQVRRKDRLAALGEMAATVAHEIRNPLGGIRGFAALLERDIDPSDDRARLVQKILVGTRELDRVVTDLLEYTRPLELDIRPVSCAELVTSALGYLDINGQEIDIVNTVKEDLTVTVDAGKTRQVLLNILLNAVQSVDSTGAVTISAETTETHATISITDTGCGILEEDLVRVFSPFYTTKEKGTGLGLAIALKTVESQGGSLDACSAPGKGSTFRIRLPRGE
jgi:PAS domain S-box-containing protein